MISEEFVTTNEYGTKFVAIEHVPAHPEMERPKDYDVSGPYRNHMAPYGRIVGTFEQWFVKAFHLYAEITLYDAGDRKYVVTYAHLYEWGRMDSLEEAIERALDCLSAWSQGYIVESI